LSLARRCLAVGEAMIRPMRLFQAKRASPPVPRADNTVRRAGPGDAEAVAGMARALSLEDGGRTSRFTPQAYLRDGFGANPVFTVLVAETEGRMRLADEAQYAGDRDIGDGAAAHLRLPAGRIPELRCRESSVTGCGGVPSPDRSHGDRVAGWRAIVAALRRLWSRGMDSTVPTNAGSW
jgi:hypothetical protein